MELHQQRTKVIATVGPASSSYTQLLNLVKAGVDVFRLNFSHGSHEDHLKVVNRVLYIRQKYNIHIGLLADLQGPKLRVGEIENNELIIKEGDILTFVNEECVGTMEKIYMSYPQFAQDVQVGERVLIDDGNLVLEVTETNKKDTVKLKVLFGGKLSSRKGVNLPNTKISLPSLTEKDKRDLDFILGLPFSWIALSFVRTAAEMKDLARRIEERNHYAKTIAKIEKPDALKNIKAIIKASNAIMVARGDLGIEVPMEQLPLVQKDIIKKCIQRARPVIVATQMMDSMIKNPSPTRAEITDVANAVLDGADAVMLSGETSVGKHPVKVVEAMRKIIAQAEQHETIFSRRIKLSPKSGSFVSDAICINACKTAEMLGAKAILGITTSGYTAFKVSSYRPKARIYIFSDNHERLATLNLVWGVRCYYYDKFTTTDGTIEDIIDILIREKKVHKDDLIVNTGTMPLKEKGMTNMLKVSKIK